MLRHWCEALCPALPSAKNKDLITKCQIKWCTAVPGVWEKMKACKSVLLTYAYSGILNIRASCSESNCNKSYSDKMQFSSWQWKYRRWWTCMCIHEHTGNSWISIEKTPWSLWAARSAIEQCPGPVCTNTWMRATCFTVRQLTVVKNTGKCAPAQLICKHFPQTLTWRYLEVF